MVKKKEFFATIAAVLITATAVLAYFNNGAGTLEIKISDPQSLGEATQVCLNYSMIEVHQAQADYDSGWVKVTDKSDWINLTATIDVNQTILYANLQAGTYNLIRLKVLDAHVTVGGTKHDASVPNKVLVTSIPNDIKLNVGETATLMVEITVNIEEVNMSKTEASSVTLIPQVTVTQT